MGQVKGALIRPEGELLRVQHVIAHLLQVVQLRLRQIQPRLSSRRWCRSIDSPKTWLQVARKTLCSRTG